MAAKSFVRFMMWEMILFRVHRVVSTRGTSESWTWDQLILHILFWVNITVTSGADDRQPVVDAMPYVW